MGSSNIDNAYQMKMYNHYCQVVDIGNKLYNKKDFSGAPDLSVYRVPLVTPYIAHMTFVRIILALCRCVSRSHSCHSIA